MNPEPAGSRAPSIILWIVVVGGAGFCAGFFGPLALNPDANQGPLLGIFLSGPGGTVLGLILFVISRVLHLSSARQWQVMGCASAILAVTTLVFCLPGPKLRGYVIETQIVGCKAPVQLTDDALQYWEQRVAKATWAPARSGWQDDARHRLETDPAVVLDVTVVRRNEIYESKKPWNSGSLSARGWVSANEKKSYYAQYAGSSCTDYPLASKSVGFVHYDSVVRPPRPEDWPPREAPALLNVSSLVLVPVEYRQLLGN